MVVKIYQMTWKVQLKWKGELPRRCLIYPLDGEKTTRRLGSGVRKYRKAVKGKKSARKMLDSLGSGESRLEYRESSCMTKRAVEQRKRKRLIVSLVRGWTLRKGKMACRDRI